MRRKDREITDYEKMLSIVQHCDCCRIGLVDTAGAAYIVPLNFGYDDQNGTLTFYFHGAKEGKKIDLIRRQTTAAFELDTRHALVTGEAACQYSYLYQCVMGNGAIEILTDQEEKRYGLQKIMSHYAEEKDWKIKEEHVNLVAVFKLEVHNWSCKEHGRKQTE